MDSVMGLFLRSGVPFGIGLLCPLFRRCLRRISGPSLGCLGFVRNAVLSGICLQCQLCRLGLRPMVLLSR